MLGPLTVRRGRELVPVPGETQRTLLALLALHRPQAVAPDRLVGELWPGRLPRNPRNALQQSVLKARAALGDPAALVTTPDHGYRLDERLVTVDAEQLSGLVRRARSDLAAGSMESAQRDFRAALQLWRDDPYPELADLPAARAEVERLAELRLVALEGRVEADLAVDSPEALVVELLALVEAHPLRERLWRHLMVALYRAGRQVDALEAYRSARRRLRDEAGVEPGADLRHTQALVLAQDPSLRPASRDSVRTTPPAVAELLGSIRSAATSMRAAGLEAERAELLLAMARALNSPPTAYDHALWLRELDAARDELEAAVAWAADHDQPEVALGLAVELSRYWDHRRLVRTGVEVLERVLAGSTGPSSARSEALTWLAFFLFERGDHDQALARLDESEREAIECHDAARQAGCYAVASVLLRGVDPSRARERAAEAVALFGRHGTRRETAYGWTTRALAALADDRLDEAAGAATAAEALYAELGDRRGLAWTKSTQAAIADATGDAGAARTLRADARAVALEVEDSRAAGLLGG